MQVGLGWRGEGLDKKGFARVVSCCKKFGGCSATKHGESWLHGKLREPLYSLYFPNAGTASQQCRAKTGTLSGFELAAARVHA